MNIYEIIAVIFSFLSVILTVKESKWCWPAGIIGIIFYSIIFYQQNMMGNFWLQSVFLGQSLLGIWNWNKESRMVYVKWFDDRTYLTALTGLFYLITVIILESNGGKMVYLDALTTILSVFAMFSIAYKIIEGWIYWIVADIIYMWIFYSSELYLSTLVYFIFLCSSIIGLIKWIKSTKTA